MVSRGNLVFGIRAFDSSILVECAESEICEALDRYLFPPLPRSQAISSPDIHLFVARSGDHFRVELNENLVAFAASLHDAALAAVKALDDAVIHRMRMFHAVHAGALLIEDRALLLPGTSHAGKSSLVAELLRRGATYFSDEYALIDDQGFTHSYPRPLLLRNGSPTQSLVLPEDLNACFASQPVAVGWILALEYDPGGRWDIQKLSQSEAVMLLLRNTPHEMAKSPEMIDFFMRVAGKALSFEGKRGEVAEAAAQVFDLVRRK